MSAGNFTLFDQGKKKVIAGTIKLGTDSIKAVLCTSSVAFTSAFAGTSTNCQYSDLTSEITGATAVGYTAGGQTLSGVTVTNSGSTTTFTSTGPSWTSSTITAKYILLYSNTNVNKDLIGYMDLDTSFAGGISDYNGTFTVNWNASGIFTA